MTTFEVHLINAIPRPRAERDNPFWSPEREVITVQAASTEAAFIQGETICSQRGGAWKCHWSTKAPEAADPTECSCWATSRNGCPVHYVRGRN